MRSLDLRVECSAQCNVRLPPPSERARAINRMIAESTAETRGKTAVRGDLEGGRGGRILQPETWIIWRAA